jgi:hypothetical protein
VTSPYRAPAYPPPERPRQLTFEELIRRGEYFGHQLHADRWTDRFPSADDPKGLPEIRLTLLDDVHLKILDDQEVSSAQRRRPASLLELLWFGIGNPDVISETGTRRLYAYGSIAWRFWQIDGTWTRHIPYLSDCSGRVRLAELDEHGLPRRAACEPIAFLYALET